MAKFLDASGVKHFWGKITDWVNGLGISNDSIDNAAYNLCCTLISSNDIEKDFPWDMYHIGNVIEIVQSYLLDKGFSICYPFYNGDENVCYLSEDRCKHCKKVIKPFRFIKREEN